MNEKPKTPEELVPMADGFKDGSWRVYTIPELGQWVHLLLQRASHRTNLVRKSMDIRDARNYWKMMGSWIDHAEMNETGD